MNFVHLCNAEIRIRPTAWNQSLAVCLLSVGQFMEASAALSVF